jgi:hypothetical protein
VKLEDIAVGSSLEGIEPTQLVSVVAVVSVGEGAVQLIYRTPDGVIKERLLGRADEGSIRPAAAERPFSFDGDGAAFQLACEAKRIDLAFLFDPMMAVHTSNVEPLPHQITAVYESMLPRQPLRFVLADDPGAGKPTRDWKANSLTPQARKTFNAIDLHWHDLRHEYACRLAERGVPITKIQYLLGLRAAADHTCARA